MRHVVYIFFIPLLRSLFQHAANNAYLFESYILRRDHLPSELNKHEGSRMFYCLLDFFFYSFLRGNDSFIGKPRLEVFSLEHAPAPYTRRPGVSDYIELSLKGCTRRINVKIHPANRLICHLE